MALVHRKDEPNSVIQYQVVKEVLEAKKIEAIDIAVVDLQDMRNQLDANIGKIDAMYISCDTLMQSGGGAVVIEYGRLYKKPSFTCLADDVRKGSLMGNVADLYAIGKKAGEKAALILKGIPPSALVTESPREGYLMINKKTAQEVGIAVPQDVLSKANEIIEG